MKIPMWKISITEGVAQDVMDGASIAAIEHPKGEMPLLPFTESNPEWTLLYNHARMGQITPQTMRRMKRNDLSYLAGMTFPHPKLMQPATAKEDPTKSNIFVFDDSDVRWDQVTKLQGNAARAKNELVRRKFFWTSFFTVLAALAGGFIGAVVGK